MTREEAAKTLNELWGVDYHYYLKEKEAEAVDMAIEALGMTRIRYKEKVIVNIRYGFDDYPLEIDLKKLTTQIAFNYLINSRPGPISWLEVTVYNNETQETGIYRHPIRKEK